MPYLWGKPSQTYLKLSMLYNPLQWPHLREWRMVKFFRTLCSLPVIPRPWMLGAIPPRLKGSNNPDPSHPTEAACMRLRARHTSLVIKSQALGNGRRPNSSVLHLLGDNAAHRYIVVKRTTDSPHTHTLMRTRGPGGLLCLSRQHCFWGMGR